MIKKQDKNEARRKRHMRIRKRLVGTPERPRLCVFRSNKHIYAQIIDDVSAVTLVCASTLDAELTQKGEEQTKKAKGKEKVQAAKTWDCEAAKKVGELVASRAKSKGVSQVVFDRGGYIYHGRVAAVADAAREAGLEF